MEMKYTNSEEYTLDQINWEVAFKKAKDVWESCTGLPITLFYFHKNDDIDGYLEVNRENPNDVYVLATGFIPVDVFKAETGRG